MTQELECLPPCHEDVVKTEHGQITSQHFMQSASIQGLISITPIHQTPQVPDSAAQQFKLHHDRVVMLSSVTP